MWIFQLLSTYQQELLLAVGIGICLGLAMQLLAPKLASVTRDPVARRLLDEMSTAGAFVRIGAAFGLFLGGHLVVEAIAQQKAPLTSKEGMLIYLLFLLGAFTLAMSFRTTLLKLTRRIIDAEQKVKSKS